MAVSTQGATGVRGRVADTKFPGGQPRLNSRKTYRCGKCGAEPGQPCRRFTGGRVNGRDVGGGYWVPVRELHRERGRD